MQLSKMDISEFIQLLSSNAPAPGGGAATALTGATGISLTKMVSELTVGKKKYDDYQEVNEQAIIKCQELQDRLLLAIDQDREAFSEVAKVFSLPKTTDEEKAFRKSEMQKALKIAIQPPLLTLQAVYEAIEVTQTIVFKSNPSVASDIGVAAHQLKAALEASLINVEVNLHMIKDQSYVDECRQKSHALHQRGLKNVEQIIRDINQQIIGD